MTPAGLWLVWGLIIVVGSLAGTFAVLLLIRAADGWVWVRRVNAAASRRYDRPSGLGTSLTWSGPREQPEAGRDSSLITGQHRKGTR